MSGAWQQQRERGSLGALRFMTWLARSLGYRSASLLLAPICLYFLAFAPRARTASRQFLGRVQGRPASLGEVYRHFHAFAGTLLDRIEVLRGRGARHDRGYDRERQLESSLLTRTGRLSGTVAARPQILAARRPHRQCLWRPQSGLLVCGDGGLLFLTADELR